MELLNQKAKKHRKTNSLWVSFNFYVNIYKKLFKFFKKDVIILL